MRFTSASCDTPDCAFTEMLVTWSVRWRRCSWALPSVKAVNVTPPSPSAEPNLEMPTIVTGTGSGVWTVVVSPTCRLPLFAAPRLITTSLPARGARPSTR